MIPTDRYLIVRAGSLYLTLILTLAIWVWRRPAPRAITGALLAFCWNVTALLMLHLAAARFGWWQFDARGGLLLGIPVDLYLSWAWLWSVVPALAFPALPLAVVATIALAADLVLMPAATPVVRLESTWLAGEMAGLLTGLVPGQLLARWTTRDERLTERAALQVLTFTGLVLVVLPTVIINASGSTWLNPMSRPAWETSLIVQIVAIPALLGLTAVQEFVTRGGGTPVPFDPPRRLVTTGVYAYVGNPMQLSGVGVLVLVGVFLRNPWISAAGVMAHCYSIGLAGWDEDADLERRFGVSWTAYRKSVRRWLPRFRPWHVPDQPPARLFVAQGCRICRDVGGWFECRGASHLTIVPAELHSSAALTRITYEPSDGARPAIGIDAIARALEHIHFGWALIGFALRLPIILPLVQLLADASGAEPRRIAPPCAQPGHDRHQASPGS